jgi:hypothetical protein
MDKNVVEKLLGELMDFSTFMGDSNALGWGIYHFEFPERLIGFSIVARKIPDAREGHKRWEIKSYSTFNL